MFSNHPIEYVGVVMGVVLNASCLSFRRRERFSVQYMILMSASNNRVILRSHTGYDLTEHTVYTSL